MLKLLRPVLPSVACAAMAVLVTAITVSLAGCGGGGDVDDCASAALSLDGRETAPTEPCRGEAR